MKYETYSEYDPHRTALAEAAFLTVWAGLRQWHDVLVLVGGMVPKYLCGDLSGTRILPRPATLDVDLGIALAEATRMKLDLPGLALGHRLYLELQAQGGARKGTQALFLALQKLNGVAHVPYDLSAK